MDLRCFVAVELPEELKKNIDRETGRLRAADADVKWVRAENLHLTLKFLGRTPEERLPAIRERLGAAAARHRGFRIRLAGAGAFPGARRPRVVWIGVSDSEALAALQKDVDAALAELGYEAEARDFTAHLTLGRVKSPRGGAALQAGIEALAGKEFGEAEVRGVSLMKSDLSPAGARYSRLYLAPLGGCA
ncbi:MAG: RNA 2',3'-cyclic phosphodiesterase [Thermodesulfovibrionales bacterium]